MIFRQSHINTFRMCPESLRAHLAGEDDDFGTDMALFGTAVHAGIELVMNGVLGEYAVSQSEAVDMALHTFRDGWEDVRQYDEKRTTLAEWGPAVSAAVAAWFKEWFLGPSYELLKRSGYLVVGVEQQFEFEVPDRDYKVQGTADLLMADLSSGKFEVIDWKTGASSYVGNQFWRHERYDIQSTMYLWALASHLGLQMADGVFTFVRVPRNKPSPIETGLPMYRDEDDWSFLVREMDAMMALEAANIDHWPLRPSDWHCSPKWCGYWHKCRGAQLGDDPWQTMPETYKGSRT